MLELIDGADGKPVLRLPPTTDLTVAQDLKLALQSALANGAGLVIDAGAVDRVTTPPIQVLLAGCIDFASAGGPALSFAGVSANFARTVSALALGQVMGVPEACNE